MKIKKLGAILLAAAISMTALAGCASSTSQNEESESNSSTYTQGNITVTTTVPETENQEEEIEDTSGPITVAFIKGPTALGAAALMNEKDNGFLFQNYDFQLYSSPDEVTGKIINGEIDIAAVPTNVASVLYNKTDGEVVIAAINTLGTLYVLENGNTISTAEDLSGKTVVMAGQGAVPEYVLQYILNKSGVTDCTVNFVSNHNEAAAAIASGSADVALLPEPFVSVAAGKNSNIRIALDVAKEWDKYSYEEKNVPNTLPMGCIVVRKAYLEQKEHRVKKFLDEYDSFMETSMEDIPLTAQYAENYEIVASADIAEKAIPNCSICFIDGSKMMRLMDNFLNIMNEANPKSIGGKVPDEEFYYIR